MNYISRTKKDVICHSVSENDSCWVSANNASHQHGTLINYEDESTPKERSLQELDENILYKGQSTSDWG